MAKSSRNQVIYPSCFVCGSKNTGAYPLFIRQTEQHGPYFPFLETHEPPDESELPTLLGKVLACFMCYTFLVQQWESYERNKIPLVKRIYWLKRVDNGPYTGVEMGIQSEYASQVFGLTSDCPSTPLEIKKTQSSSLSKVDPELESSIAPARLSPEACYPNPISLVTPYSSSISRKHDIQQEALDLSLERPNRKRKYDPIIEVDVKPSIEVLDLSMPEKTTETEMCHLCKKFFRKGTLDLVSKLEIDKHNPYFLDLALQSRQRDHVPAEKLNKVLSCKDCSAYLFSQWKCFEKLKIPYDQRYYSFKKNASDIECLKYVCYRCNKLQVPRELHLVYCYPNKEGKPYYSELQLLSPKPGMLPITQNGEVQVCEDCLKFLEHQRSSVSKAPNESDLVKKENFPIRNVPLLRAIDTNTSLPRIQVAGNNESELSVDLVSCCLCHQNYSLKQMQTLSMFPDPHNSTDMFFPFLKYLPQINQNMITEDGRILACKACHSHLTSQWVEYEKDNIPSNQRHFFLRSLSITSRSPSLSPFSSHTPRLSSGQSVTSDSPSPSLSQSENAQDSLGEEPKIPKIFEGKVLEDLEVPDSPSEEISLTLPAITTQKTLNVKINCYICGFYSKSGQTYAVKSKFNGKDMFFPFLNKHISAHPEAAIEGSTYLICLICFHSLVIQWQHYEKGRIEYHARFYNIYNFSCYICGTKTYRQRLYLLPIKVSISLNIN